MPGRAKTKKTFFANPLMFFNESNGRLLVDQVGVRTYGRDPQPLKEILKLNFTSAVRVPAANHSACPTSLPSLVSAAPGPP